MIKRILLCTVTVLLAISCSGPAPHTNLQAAKKAALNSRKDILIIFSNPTDCYACGKLEREILKKSSWKSFSDKRFERVHIILKGKDAAKKYRKYRINSIPAVFLTTSAGIPYARTGYRKGGPDAYISHIRVLIDKKARRAALLKKAVVYKDAAACSALLDRLEKDNLVQWYPALTMAGPRIDPDNKHGLKLRTLLLRYNNAVKQGMKDGLTGLLKNIRSIDPVVAGNLRLQTALTKIESEQMAKYRWKRALAALLALERTIKQPVARLYTMQGRCYYQLAKYRKSVMILKKALRLTKPGSSEKRIRAWLRSADYQLKKRKRR